MAKINDVHDIIVSAADANLTAHTYTEIYGGQFGCSIIINGVNFAVNQSSSVFVTVKSVGSIAGVCYLLGVNKDVTQGSGNILR